MTELVRVRIGNVEKNVGRGFAAKHGLEELEEPVKHRGGRPRSTTRRGGRPVKPRVSVDEAAEANQTNQINSDDEGHLADDQQGSATDPSTPEEAQQ